MSPIGTQRREPMDLLVQFGRRLTQVQSADALHQLLIDTTVRLCAPRRTLLVLETTAGLQIAKSKLPCNTQILIRRR